MILAVVCVILGALTVGCNSQQTVGLRQVAKAEASVSRGFGSFHDEPFLTLEAKQDGEAMERLVQAIQGAEKQEGIVNMTAPDYDVRLTYDDGSTKTYHLWLDERFEHATLMHTDKTHHIYRVTAKSTTVLLDIIQD